MRLTRRGSLCCTSAVALMLVSGIAGAQAWRDPAVPIERRVDDLIGRMTLAEKAAQMQNAAPAIPRLGIPAYDWWNEALHGVARAGEATMFPQAIGMAATWDRELFRLEGEVVATEGRAKYNKAQAERNFDRYYGLTFWSPNINIFRDPRWGRGQETLGEDPYLTGTLGVDFIKGVQGTDATYYKGIATPKHFAVHSGPEPLRHGFNVDPSRRDLTETYFPAFRRAIVDGEAASLMCAYNAVDGSPACASTALLTDVLRRSWGFHGFVTSDCGAVDDVTIGHKTTPDNAAAAALVVKAGTDTGCDFKDEMLELPAAVKRGLIAEAEIDVALKRLFIARMKLGLFDPPARVPFASIPITENHSAAHREVALRAARESIVLLKNDGVLPLVPGAKRIAVVGPTATSLIALEGNYAGTPVDPVLPLDGMQAAFGAGRVSYALGAPFVAELAVPVPRTAFGAGLTATFFNGPDFKGPAVATRTVREIDVNWDQVAPAPGVNRNSYSVRYTGRITPPAPGTYELVVDAHRCDLGDARERYMIAVEGAAPVSSVSDCKKAGGAGTGPTVTFTDTRPRDFVFQLAHPAGRSGSLTLSWKAPTQALRDEAVRVARDADVVVAFVGLNAWLEGEEMPLKVPGFDGGDRTAIDLPAPQAALLDAVEATGKPVVIVMQSGSAIALGERGRKAKAVLQAWYPGEAGGQAIAEVLSGRVNPSGRLPVTFYASADQLPAFGDYAMAGRTYRYFTGKPEYAFGHGLSYTRFQYGKVAVATPRVAATGEQIVSVAVRNTGPQAGDEVAQLYLTTEGREGAPVRSLKGYERVRLQPGETRTVTFRLTQRDLALADADGTMRVRAGRVRFWAGGGQPGTGAPGSAGQFEVTGEATLPR